ncbi:MAG: NAD(P)/FAD-dependent oxidoreductase, partial [Clostridiales bacterium]|jgi:phytoene dehydrogenase-like protein|nr:NAD(P)/FAD-dependent oxidoreductase [Clostridiales bacterium]
MNVYISLGVAADLSKYPKSGIYKPSAPLKTGPQTYEYLNVSNYAKDRSYSPEGYSSLTISLPGDTYEYWKALKDNGLYDEEKQKLSSKIITALSEFMPEIKGNVEVCDVATPITYERFCGNWKGSWMTEINQDNFDMAPYPNFIEGMESLYFAGQRMMPPGGLPIALITGRAAVEKLCEDTGFEFVTEGFGRTFEINI